MHAHGLFRLIGLLLATVVVAALLGACNFPDTPEPGCELIAPGIPIEDSQISDSLRPAVEWVYDGTCEPDGFRIEFAPHADFGSPQAVVGSTATATRTWTPPVDLQPMTEYGWHVAAVGDEGVVGPYSITRPLWTGPVCSGPYLWVPRLLSPDTGEVVTNPSPEYRWESRQPDCLVAGSTFAVSTDPTFSTSVISGTTGPQTSFETAIDHLVDCQTYFWRVAATAGMDLMSEYAVDFFRTDFTGACEAQVEPVTVSGSVWRDECPAYGTCSGEPPAGCQCVEGAIAADGVRQAGEDGIAGVTLAVQAGACPSASFSSEYRPVTDSDGNFSQTLPPGIYCFWIIEDMPYNTALEKPGWWTRPLAMDIPFGYTVTLTEGSSQSGLDFAWQVAPPGSVLGGIGGQLWSDLDGNGALDSGEPGIDGVEVWLSSGACDPEWSNRQGGVDPTTRTDANGRYGLESNYPDEWLSLPDGDYCVVVDPNDGHFDEVMGEGTWTHPVPDAEIAMTTIHMRSGQNHTDVNFGWGQPIGVAGGLGFTATQNLYCRFGPATVYDVIGDLVPSESSAIMGRNSQSTWVQIQNLDRAGTCWVALSGGTVAGDLSTATVIAAPPTPTPKPVPADNQAPTVQVSHSEGPNCGEVIYTATASDNVGVSKIKIYVNGDLVKTCSNTTSCSFTGGPYGADGTYYATAEDAAGNSAKSATKSFKAEYC